MSEKPFDAVDPEELARVSGGSAHTIPGVRKDDSALMGMMMQVTEAVKSMAANASKSDPMTQMLPMLLGMKGKGGSPPSGGAPSGGSAPSGGAAPSGGTPA